MESEVPSGRERGGCLSVLLVLMLIANPLTGLYYLAFGSAVRQALPNLPAWALLVLGILAFGNFACALAVWRWKKWGIYGFAASSLVIFLINASYIGVLTAALGLLGIAILALLVRPLWSRFD
jgi:hypothetical protein